MADRGDRGGRGGRGGRGRGGGDRGRGGGGRGGGGGGGGGDGSSDKRGGYRGGGGGGDGSSDKRGGYRGGRGGDNFRGGFSGTRGYDRGGRGGGDRGGRGRGGGRGGHGGGSRGPPEQPIFSPYDTIPQPNAQVQQLEDRIVSQQTASVNELTARMGKLKVGAQAAAAAANELSKDIFPARPAYGDKGEAVILWANYYQVNIKAKMLYRYTMEVVQVKTDKEVEAKSKGKKPAPPGQSSTREVKGRKLYLVIREVLNELTKNDKSVTLATEFRSQLISMQKLKLEHNPLRISIPFDGNPEKIDVFDVTFHGPIELSIEDMIKYLSSAENTGTQDHALPRYPESVDALNVIMGYGPKSKLDDISAVGSSRFFSFQNGGVIRELRQDNRALVAARGYFQSVRLGTGRLLLNTNVTHGVFKISGRMDEIFKNFQITAVKKGDSYGNKKLRYIAKFLPKTRVLCKIPLANGKDVKRTKAIQGITAAYEIRRLRMDHPPQIDPTFDYPGPKELKFWREEDGKEGKYVTVAGHYKEKYGRTLGNYPLINVGSSTKPTFWPAELVEIIPGQVVKAKLTGRETTEMLGFACRSPYANAFSITTDGRKTLGLDDEKLGDFGLSVDKQLLTVHGRVLPTPHIQYLDLKKAASKLVAPQDASWNLLGCKVVKPGAMIQRWSYVNLVHRKDHTVGRDICVRFAQFMVNMGISIAAQPIEPISQMMEITLAMQDKGGLSLVFDWAKQQGITFLLVILGTQETALYSKIKTLGDCHYGIHTSCVQASKFGDGSPGYFANVALKWNLKAGGVNHRLKEEKGFLGEGKTMVVGYDVTHPTNMANSDQAPSLVGLVSSIDKWMGQWPALSWEQASKQEMLDEALTEAFKSRIELWEKHNKGQKLENIIIFRDGVSEGQFAQVLGQELPLIRAACQAKCKTPPKLSIIVSVKRHRTRFFPTTEDKLPRNRNIRSGTVVDRGVTQARYWDFFLTAHAALKGTARPAHYTVLLDEVFRARYKADAANQLEKLTHELCYLYGRASKAVSICPPAYYADIVCTRARVHRPEIFDVSDTVTASSVAGDAASSVGDQRKQIHENLKDSMYYM